MVTGRPYFKKLAEIGGIFMQAPIFLDIAASANKMGAKREYPQY
jgi:hypothetical protein